MKKALGDETEGSVSAAIESNVAIAQLKMTTHFS